MIDNIFLNFIGGWGPDSGLPNLWFWPMAIILGEILFIWLAKKARNDLETGTVLFLKISIMFAAAFLLLVFITILGGILELLKSPWAILWLLVPIGIGLFFYINIKIFRYFNGTKKKKTKK